MSAPSFYRWLSLGAGAFLFFALDLYTKISFFCRELGIIGQLIRFERHENHGLSFNIPVPGFVPLLVAVIAITVCVIYFDKNQVSLSLGQKVALALFIGGTLGNAFDRYTLGYVRDWFAIYRSIFNLADIFILLGLGTLLLHSSQQKKSP
ncbi:MAG: signal peptidase II [Candidatus Magasanikbacteria bacterium]|nr:signal peptidase II [Candidatus Magasanikbacteria bacterium]